MEIRNKDLNDNLDIWQKRYEKLNEKIKSQEIYILELESKS